MEASSDMDEYRPSVVGPGGRHPDVASPAPGDPLADPRALQILSTEHWSLLSSRSLAYNEAFSRAGMFLSFLSATLIVMGFLLGSPSIRSVVVPVIALLLAADLFIGMATLGRLVSASGEELQAVRGMNRIRHAYRDIVPGLEPYFVTGFHDDARGVLATYGGFPSTHSPLRNLAHGLTTSTGMIGTIDAFILGALCGDLAIWFGFGEGWVVAIGLAAFAVGFTILTVAGMRAAIGGQARVHALFRSPD
jgi:hypothetical protein